MRTGSPDFLAELGRTEEAFAAGERLVQELEHAGHILSIGARATQLRLLAERGVGQSLAVGEALVVKSRQSGEPQLHAEAFAAAAFVLLAGGHPQEAHALVEELGSLTGFRFNPNYAARLPLLVRTTLGLGDVELATHLVQCAEPRTPLAEHAVAACNAQLAEAIGDRTVAGVLYGDAAERWHGFGNVPECAYALLGQGRCLVALGDASAEVPLNEARDLFRSMGYKPALAETENLLAETIAKSA
jgi:hypothetical protein